MTDSFNEFIENALCCVIPFDVDVTYFLIECICNACTCLLTAYVRVCGADVRVCVRFGFFLLWESFQIKRLTLYIITFWNMTKDVKFHYEHRKQNHPNGMYST